MATQTATSNTAFDWAYVPYQPSWPRRMARLARQHPAGVFGLVILILFVVLGLFGKQLAPYPADELSVGTPLQGPSSAHPFGLNQNGQDMLSRVMTGAHVSFVISFWAVFLGAGAGSFLGILGGYFGRWLDYLVQRSGEAFAAFPTLVLFLCCEQRSARR